MTAAHVVQALPRADQRRSTTRRPGTMTFPELFQLPASVSLTTAAAAFGMSVNTAYKLVRDGRFPCPTIRVGQRHRVPTRALMRALHIDEMPIRLADVEAGAATAEQVR